MLDILGIYIQIDFFSFSQQSDQSLVQNFCKEEQIRIMKCFNDPRRRKFRYIMGYIENVVERQLKMNKAFKSNTSLKHYGIYLIF